MLSFLPYRMRIFKSICYVTFARIVLTEFLLSEESEISCFSKNVEVNFAKIRPCSDRTCLFCMWFLYYLCRRWGAVRRFLRTSLHDYSRLSVSLTSWSLDRIRLENRDRFPFSLGFPCLWLRFGCFGFGQTQIKLLCIRLIRIFDFVLDTSPRQNANKFAFALGLFVSL